MISLDYVERTGLHLRVGLVVDDEPPLTIDDGGRLMTAAHDLAPVIGQPWDINLTGPDRAELSFEDEGARP